MNFPGIIACQKIFETQRGVYLLQNNFGPTWGKVGGNSIHDGNVAGNNRLSIACKVNSTAGWNHGPWDIGCSKRGGGATQNRIREVRYGTKTTEAGRMED